MLVALVELVLVVHGDCLQQEPVVERVGVVHGDGQQQKLVVELVLVSLVELVLVVHGDCLQQERVVESVQMKQSVLERFQVVQGSDPVQQASFSVHRDAVIAFGVAEKNI